MEFYENSEQSPEELAETEMMIREDRKNELKILAFNQKLREETYYLMNQQTEKAIEKNIPKDIEGREFEEKPEEYPDVLMINEPANLSASSLNLYY
jgi:hypothetical protein